MKKLSKVLVTLCLLASFVAATVKAPEFHKLYIRHKVGKATIKVLNLAGSGGGSGWQTEVAGKKYIITNAHVCDAIGRVGREAKLVTNDGVEYTRKIVAISGKSDLCAIEGVEELPTISISSSGPYLGEQVYSVGYPALDPMVVQSTEISGGADVRIFEGILEAQDASGAWVLFPQSLGGVSWGRCNKPKHKVSIETLDFVFFRVKVKACWTVTKGAYFTNSQIRPGSSGSVVVDWLGNAVAVVFAGDTQVFWGRFVPHKDLVEFLQEL